MEYTYSFRIYPNEEQILLIAKTFGCCRFIYNYFLDYSNSNGYSSKYTNNNIEVLDNYIKLPKLGKVPTKVHRKVEGTIINATIKKY